MRRRTPDHDDVRDMMGEGMSGLSGVSEGDDLIDVLGDLSLSPPIKHAPTGTIHIACTRVDEASTPTSPTTPPNPSTSDLYSLARTCATYTLRLVAVLAVGHVLFLLITFASDFQR